MNAPPPGKSKVFAAASLLQNGNFILLWIAYGISAFGDHLSELALLKMQNALDPGVTDVTRRNAIMLFAFMFPFFALGPVFGSLADRVSRRGVMILADIVRAVIMFEMFRILLSIHRGLGGSGEIINIGVAIVPLAALGIFAAMFSPARLSLLPTIVRSDQLVRANASTAGLGMIASIGSFYAGAWLVSRYSPQANFRLDALTFIASAMCIFMIHPPAVHRRGASEQGLSAVKHAFVYVRQHHRVFEVILCATVLWIGASVVRSIVPALVKNVFHGDYQAIGIYQGLLGVGLLAGSIVLTLLGSALRSDIAISWSFKFAGLAGLLLTAVGIWNWSKYVGGAAIFGVGFFGAGIQVSVNALLQRIVPDHFRGRIFGITDLFSMGGLLLATGLLGIPDWPNIDRFVPLIIGITSVVLITTGLWTTKIRLRRGRWGPGLNFTLNSNEFYMKLMAGYRRTSICTIPLTGPVIVAANHHSVLDPFVLAAASPNRSFGYLIAKEYAKIPVVKFMSQSIDSIPVTRTGNDTASIKLALRYLDAGKALGIFPTGRIMRHGEEQVAREGIGMLALRTGATVVPAYISGIREAIFWDKGGRFLDVLSMILPILQHHQARVKWGRPIDLSAWKGRERDRAAYAEVSDHIMREILKLAPDRKFAGIVSQDPQVAHH
jgi:1-acyl-sn-glycerol-3-phosphate acyltransferase